MLEVTTAKIIANGNDSATTFSFSPMIISAASELEVTLVTDYADIDARTETVLSEGTGTSNYSVSVSSYPGTGSITYPASGVDVLATGDRLVIRRITARTQTTDLENQGFSLPENVEERLDRLTAITQELTEQMARTLRIPVDDFESVSAGSYINVDATVTSDGRITKIASGTGTPGPQGDPGMVWEGTWSSAVTYQLDDVVYRSGSSYICVAATSINEAPESNPSVWELVAQTGSGDLISTNNLSDLTNAATARTNLGLGTISTQNANNVVITGGSVAGITDLAITDGGTGSSTAAGARTNLGFTDPILDKASPGAIGATTPGDGTFESVTAKKGAPLATESGTTKTLAATDAGYYGRFTNAAGCTLTVPLNATVALDVGFEYSGIAAGAVAVTVAAAGGVTINSPGGALSTRVQNSTFGLKKIATDEWDLTGDLA